MASVTAVHPRRGGEHFDSRRLQAELDGSSPQRRGTRKPPSRRRAPCRFIPAEAGNTTPKAITRIDDAVHPRRGGEHLRFIGAARLFVGSSPQRRGTRVQGGVGRAARRFIPAEAGNTEVARHFGVTPPVHPRRGGEHCTCHMLTFCGVGSSPQRRGTRGQNVICDRFITVHPRRGGEHLLLRQAMGQAAGSSPQRRGTQLSVAEQQVKHRFIPAEAGNTRMRRAGARMVKRGAIFGANSLRYLSTFLFALCAKELHLRQKQPA